MITDNLNFSTPLSFPLEFFKFNFHAVLHALLRGIDNQVEKWNNKMALNIEEPWTTMSELLF